MWHEYPTYMRWPKLIIKKKEYMGDAWSNAGYFPHCDGRRQLK